MPKLFLLLLLNVFNEGVGKWALREEGIIIKEDRKK